MTEIPNDVLYTEEHEWVSVEDDNIVTIGITDHAQEALGDLVYVELPDLGKTVEIGDSFVVVESVKAASEVYAPLTGEVVEVNEKLNDEPELINTSTYDKGWIVKIELKNAGELDDLMSPEAYKQHVE